MNVFNDEVNVEGVYLNQRDDTNYLVNGSIDKDIILNMEDKETINIDTEETKKMMNEERETKREMLFRQSRVLYPDKEEWILSLAIDAFMEQEEKGIDITKHKFENLSVSKSSI
jgi:hypothetical protein